MTDDDFIKAVLTRYRLDGIEQGFIATVYQRIQDDLTAQMVAERFDRADKPNEPPDTR